jgi:hypothetical protein
MSNQLTTFDMQIPRRPRRFSLHRGLLALLIALPCAPLLAEAAGDVSRANSVSASHDEIAWMSGGVGDEAREEMRKAAAAYNVHVVFSEQRGSYLAGIPFTVTRLAPGNERRIHSALSDGPLLYLKLPPGSYRIAAQIDGVWQNQHVQAGAASNSTRLSFVGKDK